MAETHFAKLYRRGGYFVECQISRSGGRAMALSTSCLLTQEISLPLPPPPHPQGPVARSMVSANHWLRSIENYASSNSGQVYK